MGLAAGVAYNEDGDALAGMGAEFRDLNNDGLPDIWHTAIENETFPLFLNRGAGRFQTATLPSRLAQLTRPMSGWSNAVVDLDNDGWKDLVVARGNVMDNIDSVSRHFHYLEPNSVFRNQGEARFEDVSASAGPDFTNPAANRGLAYGDLDNDGRMDLVLTALGAPVRVLHNETENRNHWIELQLKGVKSNRMGLGARVQITTGTGAREYSEAFTSTGYGASSDPRIHFGIGSSRTLKELQIRWPSGIRQILKNVEGDRVLPVSEPPSSR